MTIDDVNKLAKLARIEMSDAEKQEFLGNMESILKYIGQVQKVSAQVPERKVGELYNEMREDENPKNSGTYTDKIMAQAPAKEGGYFKVKQIL